MPSSIGLTRTATPTAWGSRNLPVRAKYLAKVLREGALYGGIVRTVPMNKCDALDPEIDGLDVRPAADAWLQRQIYGPGADAKRLAMALGVSMEDLEEEG